MTDTTTPVIDRSVVRLGDKAIDLRRYGVTLAMISYMIERPDQTATTRDLAIEQHGIDAVSTWETERTEKTFQAIRTRMHAAKKLLETRLGGVWFEIVDRSEKPPRWRLYATKAANHGEGATNGKVPARVISVSKLLHAAP